MNYKAAIEAILFTMGESVELGRIADAIQLNEKETKKLLDELIKEYRSSSNIPWKEQETVVTESPAQLLKELADLETDTMKKVQELMEMAGDYE